MPAFSIVSGTLFSTKTSLFSISRKKASLPSGVVMSHDIERLLRECELNAGLRFQRSSFGSKSG